MRGRQWMGTDGRPGRACARVAAALLTVAALLAGGAAGSAAAGTLTITITAGTGQVTQFDQAPCVRDDPDAGPTVCRYTVDQTLGVFLQTVLDEDRAVRWADPATCGTAEECDVPVGAADRSVSVAFEPGPANLSIIPNLLGAVGVSPAGAPRPGTPDSSTCLAPPNEPPTCSYDYPRGTTVTLTPLPDAGAGSFVDWSLDDCTGVLVCTVKLDAGQTTATVSYSAMHLSIGIPTDIRISGSANGIPLDCPGQCDADLPFGTVVTLTGTPNDPTTTLPVHWYRGCEEGEHTGPTCTVVVSMNPWWVTAALEGSLPANVPPISHVTLTVRKRGNGTVRAGALNCGRRCSRSYDWATLVTMVADPDPGWAFDHWIKGCGSRPTCRVSLGPTSNVTAVFTPAGRSASAPPAQNPPAPPPKRPPAKQPKKPALMSRLGARATGHGSRRRIALVFTLSRRARVSAALKTVRGHRRVAAWRGRTLAPGPRHLTLKVPRRVRRGAYRIAVLAVAGGAHRTLGATVRLRR